MRVVGSGLEDKGFQQIRRNGGLGLLEDRG